MRFYKYINESFLNQMSIKWASNEHQITWQNKNFVNFVYTKKPILFDTNAVFWYKPQFSFDANLMFNTAEFEHFWLFIKKILKKFGIKYYNKYRDLTQINQNPKTWQKNICQQYI